MGGGGGGVVVHLILEVKLHSFFVFLSTKPTILKIGQGIYIKEGAALAASLLDLSHYALIKKCHERSRVFYFIEKKYEIFFIDVLLFCKPLTYFVPIHDVP